MEHLTKKEYNMAKWNLDDPQLADEWATLADKENANLGDALDPKSRIELLKMIKHGEFNDQESAILKVLIGEPLNLTELGVWLGVGSKRTGGKPMSKIAARKELMRIQKVVAKRAKIKYGYNIDLSKFDTVKRQIKHDAEEKARAKKRADRELQRKHKSDLADIMQQQKELRKLRKSLNPNKK